MHIDRLPIIFAVSLLNILAIGKKNYQYLERGKIKMGKIHPTDIKFMVVLVLCLSMAFPISANDFLFTSIDTSHGLSDNQIRYILQLPDGRMVFTTTQNVNLYDGANFTSLQPTPEYISAETIQGLLPCLSER